MSPEVDHALAEVDALQGQIDALDSERQHIADSLPALRRKADALAAEISECCTVADVLHLQQAGDAAAADVAAAATVLTNLDKRLEALRRQHDAAAIRRKAAETAHRRRRFNDLVQLDADTLHRLHQAVAIHVNGARQEVGLKHAWKELFGSALVAYCPDGERIPALFSEALGALLTDA